MKIGWRLMLGVGAIPSIFLAFAVLAMPESPRWLVMQGRLDEAKVVLDKTLDTKEEAQLRLDDIKEAAKIPQDSTTGNGEGVWRELLLHPTPAKAGIASSDGKLLATIAIGFFKTIFVLVATLLLDKIGRRVLLLSSVGGMVVSLATIGFSLTIADHSETKLTWAIVLCMTMVLAFVSFFAIGMGPITNVYMSEIFPLRLRAQGVSMGVAVNRVVSGIISMTFISLYKAITIGGAFFLFAGIATVGWVFFYVCMPETRGKTLEEIECLFGKLVGWKEASKKMNDVTIER
ncbi:hypothetical protein Gotri_021760 [Gossypium trilobum]|uniref:Major facilitator superfamily (MFS) profile domain-containing protein n=1 Tax=Gossypium trilobum TaxID=34281 RepID=A0A7J9DEB1_9ROSI|nr:hypothetical protein [Gossypium trilobum]